MEVFDIVKAVSVAAVLAVKMHMTHTLLGVFDETTQEQQLDSSAYRPQALDFSASEKMKLAPL
jgi:hypothetical protein